MENENYQNRSVNAGDQSANRLANSNRTSMNNLHDNEIKNTMISMVDEVLSGSDETTRSVNNQLKFQKMEKRGKVMDKDSIRIR